MSTKGRVKLYTDGACRGNPGPGGWAVLMHYNGVEKILSGGELHTTNNRMELEAAIQGLCALKRNCAVDLYTDSEYLQKGITLWIKKWRQNDWKNSQKKPVKNQEWWQRLDEAVGEHHVTWHWVKGHSGHPENERVDLLARLAVDEILACQRKS